MILLKYNDANYLNVDNLEIAYKVGNSYDVYVKGYNVAHRIPAELFEKFLEDGSKDGTIKIIV